MSRQKLYVEYAAWPEQDRVLWDAAFQSGSDPFDDCGSAAHLAERSRLQLQYAYGKFLKFLSARHPDLLARDPGERVNRKTIGDYVNWQPVTCGGITIAIYLHHLWLVLKYMCPADDWSWLPPISNRIAAKAKKKPERNNLVTSETLYALGTKLMDDGMADDEAKAITVTRAQKYRDGLIIAFLALIPLRRRTLAALRIGNHLVRSGELWALDIPAEDTKAKRPLEYPVGVELTKRIDLYLNAIRSKIGGAARHDYLWASTKSRPMSSPAIYNAVRKRTSKALGFPVNLHRFRTAAATLWSIKDPANVRGAKDLLGHATYATTEEYYVMAQSRVAGRVLARAINDLEKD